MARRPGIASSSGLAFRAAGSRVYSFVAEPLSEADRRAATNLLQPDRAADARLVAIVLLAAFAILIQRYVLSDDPNRLLIWISSAGFEDTARWLYYHFTDVQTGRYNSLLLWAAGIVTCYLVIPILVLKSFGARLGDYGFRLGPRGDLGIYAVILAAALPLVVLMANEPSFLRTYPFYKPAAGETLWPRFVGFEALYVLQFVAVEFFFRGLLIHGVKHRAGAFAILFPLIPYMMVHFGKPMIECAASVVAGLFLGFMSLRTGSILYGMGLHIAVALTMDLTALVLLGHIF